MALKVQVSSTVSSIVTENSFNEDLTIGQLKHKLELITGANSSSMELSLYDGEDFLYRIDGDYKTIGSYNVKNNMRIHVVDKSGSSLHLDDLSSVKKFELSDEAYAQKSDSVRAFKQKMKFGRFAEFSEEEKARKSDEKMKAEQWEKEKAKSITHNSRCEVSVPGQPRKRGTVMFVGQVDFKPGYWVGVRYDEPLGKHDGSVSGKKYFECPHPYGAFVKPENVTVGDFPEFGLSDDDEM